MTTKKPPVAAKPAPKTEQAEGEEVEQQEAREGEAAEAEAGGESEEQPDYQAENERLRRENEDLRNRQTQTPAPAATPKVTAAQLRAMGEAQRKTIEEQFGVSFEEIVHTVESQEIRAENQEVKAKLNVSEVLEDAQAADPRVATLKVHMKAYINRLPLEVRADPKRLAEEIEHSKVYARGVLAGKKPPLPAKAGGGRVKPNPAPSPEDEGETPELEEGEVAAGSEVTFKDTGAKITVGLPDQISSKKRSALKHPTDPNGVMFKNADKPPVFNRGDD